MHFQDTASKVKKKSEIVQTLITVPGNKKCSPKFPSELFDVSISIQVSER